MKKSQTQTILAAIALFCFALLVYAFYLQHGPEKQQPCPLCILQRYAYFLLGVAALVGAILPRRAILWIATFIAAGGGGLALWQVLKGGSMTSCQRDPIGIFVNQLPMADWWPEYLFATGGCSDRFFTLGLPVSVWSLVCFAGVTAGLTCLAIKMHPPR
ncbi:MAG: disulfide bond formation protein B [Betaproteobacteria bacterium]|jgi:disulfide bond formation protein DsbB